MTSAASQRAVPFYCPYCGDEDLRHDEAGHGSWHCGSCTHVFRLSFTGIAARTSTTAAPGGSP